MLMFATVIVYAHLRSSIQGRCDTFDGYPRQASQAKAQKRQVNPDQIAGSVGCTIGQLSFPYLA